MRVIQIFIWLLIFFVGVSNTFSQSSNDIVAKAGDIIISKDEFRKRHEFLPHVRTGESYDSTSFKQNFLQTLIAEKLLAKSAMIEGIDRSQKFRVTMENLSVVYLRDALYKKEVLDKIVIPDSEIVRGQFRMLRSIRTKFIFSQDEKEIGKLYSEIHSGASFDSILATRPENMEQKEAAEITFGSMNEKMEDAIYEIAVGQITSPVELKEGWYICKIYSITSKNDLTNSEKAKIEKIIKSRIEDKIYQTFYRQFFKGVVVNADRLIMERLYLVVTNYLNENKKKLNKDKAGKYKIGEADAPKIKNSFNEKDLDGILIKFSKNPIKLSKLFDYLTFQDFEFYSIDSTEIKTRLSAYVRNYIQNEMFVREAKKRGYDKLPEVVSELKMWSDYYLAHEKMKNIYKDESVTDDEAYKFFAKTNQIVQQPDEYNISEIASNDLTTIELALNELDKGLDFEDLAIKYASDDSSRTHKGLSGFFKAVEKEEIGKVVPQMKIGDVYGPIKTTDGYSLIKLVEKREGSKEKIATFEEAKEDIKNIMKTDKMYKSLDDETAKLAATYGVEINEAVLNSVKVSPVNMIVLRRFGFGGQLLAVPFTPNFSSWFKKYEQMKKRNLL